MASESSERYVATPLRAFIARKRTRRRTDSHFRIELMGIVLIGTDHRFRLPLPGTQRQRGGFRAQGGERYERLVTYCVEKLNVKTILEETHPDQEKLCPTIASTLLSA